MRNNVANSSNKLDRIYKTRISISWIKVEPAAHEWDPVESHMRLSLRDTERILDFEPNSPPTKMAAAAVDSQQRNVLKEAFLFWFGLVLNVVLLRLWSQLVEWKKELL